MNLYHIEVHDGEIHRICTRLNVDYTEEVISDVIILKGTPEQCQQYIDVM